MHDCPRCGFACDCDGEDTELPANALSCTCDCEEGGDLGEADLEFDCGMDRNGNCGKVGSEECDLECPNSGRVKN